MALIKCPECGKEISNKATSCPSCGYPIGKATTVEKNMEAETQRALRPDEQFCSSCRAIIKKAAEICPKCGVRVKAREEYRKSRYTNEEIKRIVIKILWVLLLLFFVIVAARMFYNDYKGAQEQAIREGWFEPDRK